MIAENTKTRIHTVLVALLLLIGMYTPTAIAGVKSNLYNQINFLVVGILYVLLIFTVGHLLKYGLFALAGITAVFFFATLTTELNQISWGPAFFYVLIGLMYCVDLRKVSPGKLINPLFLVVNVINLIMGIGIVFMNPMVGEFVIRHYSAFYDELVPWMMREGKPVLTFSTHSIAGFYLHLLFYLNLKTYTATANKVYLLFAAGYIFLCFSLNSSTGYVFGFLACVVLLVALWKDKSRLAVVTIVGSAILLVLLNLFGVRDNLYVLFLEFQIRLSSTTSGVISRYADQGVLANTFDYIKNNPFNPIGAGFDDNLWLTDSGMVNAWIRGSLLLFLLVYGVLVFYLKTQIEDKRTAYYLIAVILIFEIGFPNLIYMRTFFLIPFAIIYLNYLTDNPHLMKKKKKRKRIVLKRLEQTAW